ncbi:hypothetical protein LTR09_004772 [Extremus antarcticus]|uniref:Wax synthase domain-containing protein n=1 Tax=Extremus antarcticus TaxID=702011 RepID=A0AAJ0GCG6_9PEZI|nr:hypothetical protein LTR09_004772 [Extremus antarcticus]
MAAATVHCWVHMEGVDVISVDVLLCFCYFLWLKDVQNDFVYVVERKVGRGNANGSITGSNGNPDVNTGPAGTAVVEERYPPTLLSRIRWVGILLVSIRLHNWRIGDFSHDRRQPPPPAGMSRSAFVELAIISFVRGYLILDFTRAYISYDPYFTDPRVTVSSPLPFEALHFIPPRLPRSAIIGAQAWAAISQMMYLPCLLPLGLNALGFLPDEWSPHVWPRLFGSWSEIPRTGVRAFWGVYWHQTMRVMTTGPGIALADTLRMERRSMLSWEVDGFSPSALFSEQEAGHHQPTGG